MVKEYFHQLIFTSPFEGFFPIAGFALIVGSAIILAAWFRRDTWPWSDLREMSEDLWEKTKRYFPNALWQEAILVTLFFWLRAAGMELWAAAIIVGLFFGMVGHFGNRALMGWTAGMGVAYCLFYEQYHNVWLLSLAHGYVGTVFHACTPERFNEGLRVWRRDD